MPLLEELPERFAELGSELIEREGGDPPWHCLVAEPAMYGAGVDATSPAYLGKAQAARLAELLKPTGLHQRTSARDPGDLVDRVCGYGLPHSCLCRLCLCEAYSVAALDLASSLCIRCVFIALLLQ